jgi:hypothetical protein
LPVSLPGSSSVRFVGLSPWRSLLASTEFIRKTWNSPVRLDVNEKYDTEFVGPPL